MVLYYRSSTALEKIDLVNLIQNLELSNLDEDDDTAGHSGDQGTHRHEPEVSRRAEHAEGGQAAGHDQHPDTLTEISSTLTMSKSCETLPH